MNILSYQTRPNDAFRTPTTDVMTHYWIGYKLAPMRRHGALMTYNANGIDWLEYQ